MFQPNVSVSDLKKEWVIFKRIKRTNYYHRGNGYRQCSTTPRQAARYKTKEEAVAEQTRLNAGRKSYRFRVETSDKHFVNNWRIDYQTWSDQVAIISEPISFTSLANSKKVLNHTLNDKKVDVLKKLDDAMSRCTDEHQRIEMRYNEMLERAKAERQEALTRAATRAAHLVQAKAWVQNTDLDTEFVEKYQTDADKKAQILFGKRD